MSQLSTIQLAALIAWAAVGIFVTIRWKWREPEVTLLDVICAIIIGAPFGVLVFVGWLLSHVKVKSTP